MPTSDAPKCPQAKRLRQLTQLLNSEEGGDLDVQAEASQALDWLATYLENRSLYHKRQQLIRKHALKIAKERGLVDTDEFKQTINAEVFNHVVNQEPEEEPDHDD